MRGGVYWSRTILLPMEYWAEYKKKKRISKINIVQFCITAISAHCSRTVIIITTTISNNIISNTITGLEISTGQPPVMMISQISCSVIPRQTISSLSTPTIIIIIHYYNCATRRTIVTSTSFSLFFDIF